MSAQPKGSPPAPAGMAMTTRGERTDLLVADLLAQARTPQERAQAFELAGALRQAQLIQRSSQMLSATEWGAALSEVRRAAFARFCLALGADPLRHIDLLGGKPFVNGAYFRDVIAASPDFERADDPVWIHSDPRLESCAGCGKPFGADVVHGHGSDEVTEENRRRLADRVTRARLRLEQNVPDDSPAACILVLHYRGRGPFGGIGEVHPGKVRHGPNAGVKDRDPIGLDSPRATAETRAWRECGEKSEATWFRTHAATLKQLETKLVTSYQAEKVGPGAAAERPPEAVVVEEVLIEPVASAPASSTAAEALERHAASKVCAREDPHPRSECGYHKGKA